MKIKNKQGNNDGFWVVFFYAVFILLFLGMGVGGVYYSVNKFYRHINLVSNGVKTEARITDMKKVGRRIVTGMEVLKCILR
jgi:hypothetical protein